MTTVMNARMVLHIGASKTATTTLQLNVFAGLREIIFLGKPFPHQREQKLDAISKADCEILSKVVNDITELPVDQNMDDEMSMVHAVIGAMEEPSARRIVLSEEGLCNNKHASFDVIAKRLHATFGPADIMLTIRNQLSVLPSLYLHKMKKKERRVTFDNWLDEAFADPTARRREGESIEQYRYNAVLESFGEVFSNRIGVFLYEDLVANRMKFATQLAKFISADATRVMMLLDSSPKNVGKSENWYRHQDLVQRYARIKAMLAPRLDVARTFPPLAWAKDRIKARLQAKADSGPPMKVEMSAQSRQRIVDYFGADNLALGENYGLDLRTLSYPGCD